MNICVFCSSSNAVSKQYFREAEILGQSIAKIKHTLVYGGANVGLMEHLAHSVKQNKGKVIGIIPEKIHQKLLGSEHPDELIITPTMDSRKSKMREISDAFIALPGGFGTIEEILEVITLKQLDYHRKAIVFINTNQFYNSLFQQFEKSFEQNFAKENYRNLYKIVNNSEEAIQYIENYKELSPQDKWFIVPEKD